MCGLSDLLAYQKERYFPKKEPFRSCDFYFHVCGLAGARGGVGIKKLKATPVLLEEVVIGQLAGNYGALIRSPPLWR